VIRDLLRVGVGELFLKIGTRLLAPEIEREVAAFSEATREVERREEHVGFTREALRLIEQPSGETRGSPDEEPELRGSLRSVGRR
jgi:hypothetical protein